MAKVKKREATRKKKPQATRTTSGAQSFSLKRAGNAATDPQRKLPGSKKPGFYRDKAKINLLNMYNSKPDKAKMKEQALEPARIQPDRRWFGNTRVITQTRLEEFRETMEKARKDPYSVILKRAKLPVSLFSSTTTNKAPRVNLLSLEPFAQTFGSKQRRKRPRIDIDSFADMASEVEKKQKQYCDGQDSSLIKEEIEAREAVSDEVFKKGTSRRIWQELYKVIDSSDVVVQVLDARDPIGTRCTHLENHIRKDRPNKHVILLLNKCDLVPSWCASRWMKILASEYPTVAFHSSLTNSFGKLTLLNLLRQYASLLKERKHVSVGFVGYPNVGKSSVINTLRSKRVCKAAPIPGETKVWQYVALTDRIHLIDCPGIVPPDGDDDTAKVLKGVVRAERISMPEAHIDKVLERAKRKDILKRYGLDIEASWETSEDFLKLVAKRYGKLLKGGEPDISTAARIVLFDWQRGRIPFFVAPPFAKDRPGAEAPSSISTNDDDDVTETSQIAEESREELHSDVETAESNQD